MKTYHRQNWNSVKNVAENSCQIVLLFIKEVVLNYIQNPSFMDLEASLLLPLTNSIKLLIATYGIMIKFSNFHISGREYGFGSIE